MPYSKDLRHPADRRRLGTWANEKKVQLAINNPLDADILVLSNAANFGYWLKRAKQPVILDLVDAYLGENPSLIKDVLRNFVRSIRGTSNFHWITYTRHLRAACRESAGIIVASPEQRELLLAFNKNIFVILDDHSEIDKFISSHSKPSIPTATMPHIFWEGFGYTLKHFEFMAKELDKFLNESNWGMYLVTVGEFPRWGGYLGKVHTRSLIDEMFPLSGSKIELISWSLENLVNFANKSQFAIIPINKEDNFAVLKSENKLLSMWHLGLPTFCTDIPSYSRVTTAARLEQTCLVEEDWYKTFAHISLSLDTLEEIGNLSALYISKNHTHTHIVEQWDHVLNGLTEYEL